jgi:hypothetical protein
MVIIIANLVSDMVTDEAWQAKAKGLLKGELKRRGIGYRDLAARLAAMGVPETEQNIANKISRGGFSAVFLIQCMEAVGCRNLQIGVD